MSLLSRNTRKQGIWNLSRRREPLASTKPGKARCDKSEYLFQVAKYSFFVT